MDQPPTEKTALDPPHENQNMSTRQSQMNELPEIREDRITQIQHSLENGTYAVSAEQLAEKIIREL